MDCVERFGSERCRPPGPPSDDGATESARMWPVLSWPSAVKTLDRYLIREIVPPFGLALGLFTFLLAVKPMLEYTQDLLVKGVPLQTIGFLLLMLLPQSLGVTIPMALLTGILMGLGRLSADREAVAMLACGVSPMRLLRPVMGLVPRGVRPIDARDVAAALIAATLSGKPGMHHLDSARMQGAYQR